MKAKIKTQVNDIVVGRIGLVGTNHDVRFDRFKKILDENNDIISINYNGIIDFELKNLMCVVSKDEAKKILPHYPGMNGARNFEFYLTFNGDCSFTLQRKTRSGFETITLDNSNIKIN